LTPSKGTGLMSGGAVYFLVFGPLRPTTWAEYFGWPPNRYSGPTWRPFAGVFFVELGVALVILVLAGAIR
jgi:hypothetical protein